MCFLTFPVQWSMVTMLDNANTEPCSSCWSHWVKPVDVLDPWRVCLRFLEFTPVAVMREDHCGVLWTLGDGAWWWRWRKVIVRQWEVVYSGFWRWISWFSWCGCEGERSQRLGKDFGLSCFGVAVFRRMRVTVNWATGAEGGMGLTQECWVFR